MPRQIRGTYLLLLLPLALLCAQCSTDTTTGPHQTRDPSETSKTIGPDGGEIWLGNEACVSIPAQALDSEATITIARIDSPAALPDNHITHGAAYSFTPHGQLFDSPVQICIAYEPDQTAIGMSAMRLDSQVDVTWAPVIGADLGDGMATIAATSFSILRVTSLRELDAIYVSNSSRGADADGSMVDPLPTVGAGIAASIANGEPWLSVMVATGEYSEAITFVEGISIHGGLDESTWEPTTAEHAHSVIRLGDSAARAADIHELTEISGLVLIAADATAPSTNSVALHVSGCSDGLRFRNCSFEAGNGAPGNAGDPGASGVIGGHGKNAGADYNSNHMAGGPGGTDGSHHAGGAGGAASYVGSDVVNGTGKAGYGNFCGGLGGSVGGLLPAGDGYSGGSGGNGAHGSGGSNGQPGTSDGWTAIPAPDNGTGGAPGCGGGGGGGGFKWITGGMGGAGGGGGGSGGLPAKGGDGGGSSFAVYLWNSAPVFERCIFTSASGGNGGVGGDGGSGGEGGDGGASLGGENEWVNGGSGGKGGHGGSGGSGGGGSGGHSFCVYRLGALCEFADFSACHEEDWHPGTGGLGAPGGNGAGGARGADGSAARIGPRL